MDKEQIKYILEALIFASDTPLTLRQMSSILKDVKTTEIEAALTELENDYKPRALMLKKVSGGRQFTTKPAYAEWVGQMFEEKARSRLSRAALETLAIIAFKQPISRVEVSAIRGVGSEGVIKKLLDARLITISGRDSGPGRALLFKTTPEFLQYFGINDISDLPRPKEVEELLAEGEGGKLLEDLPEEALLTEQALQDENKKEGDAAAGEMTGAETSDEAKSASERGAPKADPTDQRKEIKETAENAAQ